MRKLIRELIESLKQLIELLNDKQEPANEPDPVLEPIVITVDKIEGEFHGRE